MTATQLLAVSVVASILTAGTGWAVGRVLEQRIADPTLRERIWAAALYLPALPVLIVSALLLLPARVIRVSETAADAAPVAPIETPSATMAFSLADGLQDAALAVLVLALILFLVRALQTGIRLLSLRRLMRATVPASPQLRAHVESLARRSGVAAPEVRVAPTGAEAFLTGLRKPVLVLPAAVADAPDQPATAAVCAHELAHLRRGDHRALWAEELLLAVLAINPLLGDVRRRRAAAREEACDALALAGADNRTRRAYARALLAALRDPLRQDVPALTFTPSKRTFAMLRLQAILTPPVSAAPRLHRLSVALGAVIVAGVCTASVALAAQRDTTVEIVPALPVEVAPTRADAVNAPVAPPPPALTVREAIERPSQLSETPAQATPVAPTPVNDQAGRPSIIRNPSWVQHPVPQFPAAAFANNVDRARVVLTCTAQADGRLGDCAVVSEDPVGNGFGSAAVSAAQDARLSPRSVDEAAPNATVTFSVVFRAA